MVDAIIMEPVSDWAKMGFLYMLNHSQPALPLTIPGTETN